MACTGPAAGPSVGARFNEIQSDVPILIPKVLCWPALGLQYSLTQANYQMRYSLTQANYQNYLQHQLLCMESLFVELHFKCVVGIYCSPNVEAKLIIYSLTSKFMHFAGRFKECILISKEKANEIWSDGHLE